MAMAQSGNAGALVAQQVLGVGPALVLFAHQVGHRYAHVLQPDLVHVVAAVQRACRHRVQQVARLHARPGGQHLDLQLATGHVVDLLRIVARELVEDVRGGPRALEP
ncbi:hypothetical protein G6F60_015590 [Rhizopus arrhizus]|nr:hypothetical protein G6F60_015590 [Rhizopus arrhizus]